MMKNFLGFLAVVVFAACGRVASPTMNDGGAMDAPVHDGAADAPMNDGGPMDADAGSDGSLPVCGGEATSDCDFEHAYSLCPHDQGCMVCPQRTDACGAVTVWVVFGPTGPCACPPVGPSHWDDGGCRSSTDAGDASGTACCAISAAPTCGATVAMGGSPTGGTPHACAVITNANPAALELVSDTNGCPAWLTVGDATCPVLDGGSTD